MIVLGVDVQDAPGTVGASEGGRRIVYAWVTTGEEPRISPGLWTLMRAEFDRNGHQMLTPGKVRHLRRITNRSRR